LGRTGDIAVPNDRVRAYYEGEVDTADYWDPDNMGDCDIVVLLPHGFGKLTYRVEGEVLETYEGQFFMGEYSGEGKMVRLGKEYVGKFEKHRFVD
jgi:hypothetical protein